MALKSPRYFYQLMEKPLGRYFQVRSPCYHAAQCNQKAPIPVSLRWQARSEKAKKGQASTLITASTSVHFPQPVSIDLIIKSDSVITNSIGKEMGCEAGRCNKNVYPIRHFYCNTITRRVANQGWRGPLSPWGKTDPAEHQPSISMSRGIPTHYFNVSAYFNVSGSQCSVSGAFYSFF